ncbi:MAG TPA: B-box zinc finger protein [Bryobacteraceae bacterium]|nr:B-box zinc finger protein [Bryobacteraceae bacterium]
MNCQNHPDAAATAYCRACGKPVCDQCRRDAQGTVYCAEHAPAVAPPPNPPPAPAPAPSAYTRPLYSDVSPGLALLLGFIPGVGAIYNGQYAKGLVHAVIFGIIISILSANESGAEAVFILLLMAWIFYMPFEAYHTALKRRNGERVDEYSGLVNLRGGGSGPAAGIVLVLLGVVLLLNTLNIFNFAYLARYWPVVLIAAGVYLLYNRFSGHGASERGD